MCIPLLSRPKCRPLPKRIIFCLARQPPQLQNVHHLADFGYKTTQLVKSTASLADCVIVLYVKKCRLKLPTPLLFLNCADVVCLNRTTNSSLQ